MSKITSEQLNKFIHEQENHAYIREDFDLDEAMGHLREYATHLRERESAKVEVTGFIVNNVRAEIMNAAANAGHFEIVLNDAWVRMALEAVAPILASARVPDDVQRYHLLRSGKSGISLPLGAEALDLYLDRKLAAAPKPEKE